MEIRTNKPVDYREMLGRLSPAELYDQEQDSYGVLIVTMPDGRYSVHLGDNTLYYNLESMPDEFKLNLLLTKARYKVDEVSTEYKTFTYENYRDTMFAVSGHRQSYRPRDFRPIGFMLKPGIYLITVQYDQIKKYYEKEKDHERV